MTRNKFTLDRQVVGSFNNSGAAKRKSTKKGPAGVGMQDSNLVTFRSINCWKGNDKKSFSPLPFTRRSDETSAECSPDNHDKV